VRLWVFNTKSDEKNIEHKKEFHRNKRGKKPDKYWLDIGCYANASNLKLLTFKND
jgi:hypothetical protein